MTRDTSEGLKATKVAKSATELTKQAQTIKRMKRSKLVPLSQISKGNPIHRPLRYHEKKLLRKHDFLQYKDDNWHEPFSVVKYHLEDREDYRRYLRLVGLIRQLILYLRYLPPDSKVRTQITQQLIGKLYSMKLIGNINNLSEVDKLGVEAFCKRRLSSVLCDLKMASSCKLAAEMIHHGHVRVGTTQIRDPAFLVTRTMDDYITWMSESKIKGHIDTFNQQRDDFS